MTATPDLSAEISPLILELNEDGIEPRERQSRLQEITAKYEMHLLEKAVSYFQATYPIQSASNILTRPQTYSFIAIAVWLAVMAYLSPEILPPMISTAYITYCLVLALLRCWLLLESVRVPEARAAPPEHKADYELPVITILVPLYQEAASVPYIHEALSALDYPQDKLDIKILLEENDLGTEKAARQYFLDTQYHLIVVPDSAPQTKPKACNYGLWLARGDLVVVYDAEDRPDPDQLRIAAKLFATAPEQVACAQARLNYYNPERNGLTRLFTLEYTFLFDTLLPVFCRHNMPIPLGGTSNFFRTHVLQEIGGWDPYNVTEDADIGLRLSDSSYRTTMLNSTTWEEATPDMRGWLRQRSRWIKGYIQKWLVHLRQPGGSLMSGQFWRKQVTLHFVVASVIVAALINPIFWLLFVLWLAGFQGIESSFFPEPLGGLAVTSFLLGNFLLVYLYMIAPLNRRWLQHTPYALLLPLYWLLQSIAGYMALWQLCRNPFYWEKTHHNPTTEIPTDAPY
ncbi:glycosyltransferase family 2 protein [Parvularcula sp. IMCC14364]|uniref:glycosyltransferase family 2 protein n=1 Tax=Parvularcula sp. IMCC14364 TaxID=3067902 RepID=UPI00274211F8|nr:glycosyltransferase family 2 protein [Parvularcula sp. IMCC14364]